MQIHYLVTQVLTYKGQSMLISDFLAGVQTLVSGRLYPKQIAAGSLGGAVNSGLCELNLVTGTVKRVR